MGAQAYEEVDSAETDFLRVAPHRRCKISVKVANHVHPCVSTAGEGNWRLRGQLVPVVYRDALVTE